MPSKKFAVLTDSACDMPYQLAEERGIDIMNFNLSVDAKSYTEREDFTFEEYYDILRNCQGIPATAHVTIPRFLAQFEEYDDAGVQQVLYVSINASGSATNDAAVMAKRNFYENRPTSQMEIFIVDSHCYSMAYGWYVAEAARRLGEGDAMQDVVDWLNDVFSRMEILLAAFSLKFIKKSGRISAAAAFAGELLGLRPIITLNDGISTVEKKVRGDKEVLPAMLEYAEEAMDERLEYQVGGTDMEMVKQLAEMCEARFGTPPKQLFLLGAAVATNTGPDAIAITFIGKQRRPPDVAK